MKDDTIYSVYVQSTADEMAMNKLKAIYDEYIPYLKPDKKNAAEIIDHIKSKYPTEEDASARAKKVVELNALGHRQYLPDGIFQEDTALDTTTLIVKNEGAGKTLYDKQEQDYYDLLKEQKSLMKNPEESPFETCPIVIGIEKHSGYVFVEGSPSLADEITLLQGLNAKELKNVYLVAHYIQILKKNNQLESVLNR
jgi:hypothetical protein